MIDGTLPAADLDRNVVDNGALTRLERRHRHGGCTELSCASTAPALVPLAYLRPPPTLTLAAAAALEAAIVARGGATSRDGGALVTLAHAMAGAAQHELQPDLCRRQPRTHYGISCDGAEWYNWLPYAIFTILVYPIGTPLFFSLVLRNDWEEIGRLAYMERDCDAREKKLGQRRASIAKVDSSTQLDKLMNAIARIRARSNAARRAAAFVKKPIQPYKISCAYFEVETLARRSSWAAGVLHSRIDPSKFALQGVSVCPDWKA